MFLLPVKSTNMQNLAKYFSPDAQVYILKIYKQWRTGKEINQTLAGLVKFSLRGLQFSIPVSIDTRHVWWNAHSLFLCFMSNLIWFNKKIPLFQNVVSSFFPIFISPFDNKRAQPQCLSNKSNYLILSLYSMCLHNMGNHGSPQYLVSYRS